MLLRPFTYHSKAADKGVACASLVDPLHMHHFEAGLLHLMLRVEIWIGWKPGFRCGIVDWKMRISPTLRVGEDIDLDLSHSSTKLIRQRSVAVVQSK